MGRGRKRVDTNRILGPYYDKDRSRWMYAVVINGRRTWFRCSKVCTKEEAEAEVAGAWRELNIPAEATVEYAINQFVGYVEQYASRATAVSDRSALLPLLRIARDHLITSLAPKHVDQYLRALDEPVVPANHRTPRPLSMATKRSYFLALARASKWWARHHYTHKDIVAEYLAHRQDPLPWGSKAGAKQINRGKAQLRNLGEARKYLDTAMERPTAEERVAAALPLLTGISSGELLHIQAGAVDFDAGVIHIRSAEMDDGEEGWAVKTSSRVRSVTIPDSLWNDLEELAAGLEPTQFLFRAILDCPKTGHRADWRRGEEPRTPGWLRALVKRVCTEADVRIVCPHGLRATHASLRAAVADEAVAKIGDALGHADHGKTAANHYVGAPANVPVLRVVGRKGG